MWAEFQCKLVRIIDWGLCDQEQNETHSLITFRMFSCKYCTFCYAWVLCESLWPWVILLSVSICGCFFSFSLLYWLQRTIIQIPACDVRLDLSECTSGLTVNLLVTAYIASAWLCQIKCFSSRMLQEYSRSLYNTTQQGASIVIFTYFTLIVTF